MIPALGRAERRLGESAGCDSGISWSPDGKFLAVADKSSAGAPFRLFLLFSETGKKRSISSPPTEYHGDFSPHFSPDGKTLAFLRAPSFGPFGRVAIYSLSISNSGEAGDEVRRLTPDHVLIGGLDFTPDGRSIVYSQDATLWTIPATGGSPERLVGGDNASDISISRVSNRLVYSRVSFDPNIWRIPGLSH
jgi:Tol biopolymer transport system component